MESITVTGSGAAVPIYGTLADAQSYANDTFGPTYTKWRLTSAGGKTSVDDQRRTLIAATRFIDAQGWNPDTAGDFATRDAIEVAGVPLFQRACYELAVLILADSTLPQNQDQGTNVRAVGAGSARVEFFNPTSALFGTAPVLPPSIMRLIGAYLASSAASTGGAPEGQSAGCESPFSSEASYKRWWPY
jgi:hypothetical protein